MKVEAVRDILAKIRKVRVAVYGDFCLDAYWILDPRGSEVSVETGVKALAAGKHYYSLGGAANVVANMAALEPAKITAIGVIGRDIFGREMIRQMEAMSVDTSGMVVQDECFDTMTYGKEYVGHTERERLDFGVFNRRTLATDKALVESLRVAFASCDVVVLNQQVHDSITNESFCDAVNTLINEFPARIVIADTRHYSGKFRNVYRKTNEREAARINGVDVTDESPLGLPEVRRFAAGLYAQDGKPVFITRGARGMLVHDDHGAKEIPGIQVLSKLDPVGAGDTVLSALACCLGAGIGPADAAEFAGLAAIVTAQKLFQTGTACGAEILSVAWDTGYIHQPELAEDPRQAAYYGDSDIELCCGADRLPRGAISHAVFDHDGTISVLRQGWETVMEPVMIRAILGDRYIDADETLYHRVRNRVCDYIMKSSGLQTSVQMEALVGLVREFGIVPADRVLDQSGYRAAFDTALMELVGKRMSKLVSGELSVEDYTIKGIVPFLERLRKRGITLYLISGSSSENVAAEARAMGYANLFNGGIYGSSGDTKRYSKKIMIETLLRDNHVGGSELICFGDGPVEIRECVRHGGTAVGMATDEVRRHGLNHEKRTRLVKAGAHAIAPDFSQSDILTRLVFGR